MMKSRSRLNRIPAILSLPEKASEIFNRVLKMRLPLERSFSGREFALILTAAFMLILFAVIRPLATYKTVSQIGAALLCLPSVGLSAYRLIRRRQVPGEEITIVIAALIAVLLKEYLEAALFFLFISLLRLTQGYALLHREVEMDRIQEEKEAFYPLISRWDAEESRHGALSFSVCFGVFVLFILVGTVCLLLALFHLSEPEKWLHGAMIAFALASPAAAIYSVLLIHFGTACSAARASILFSDDRVPEDYRRCRLFAFSKTGTVTDGRYVISEIAPVGISEEELLKIAALAESSSEHPIAKTLKEAAGLRDDSSLRELITVEELPGKGISAFYAGHQIYVGNGTLLDEHGIWFAVPAKSGSAIHVAVDNSYRGYIMISDAIRENAFDALEELREAGASTLVMLTGDVRSTARSLASSLNFDMVKPELTPEEKGTAVKYLRSVHGDNAQIACVGDGYQDAEMFEEADICICLEADTDSSAEVRIFSGDILSIPKSYRICRNAARMLLISLATALAVKIILFVLGMFSLLPDAIVLAVDSIVGTLLTVYALLSFRID